MPRKSAWVGPQRPTDKEFAELCMDAAVACANGSRLFNIEENEDFHGPQRLMIEDLIYTIEKVIDSVRHLNTAITACLSDALPIDRVVDADVVEAGPF